MAKDGLGVVGLFMKKNKPNLVSLLSKNTVVIEDFDAGFDKPNNFLKPEFKSKLDKLKSLID